MEIRSIRSDAELEEVFDLCDAAFDDTPREFFVASVKNDPDWEPWQTRVLVEDGQILSSVQIFVRQIRFADAWVPCGGVGNVATHPGARGRGYASLVMRDVLSTLRQRRLPLSVLFTGIFGFYARFGYRVLPLHRWEFARDGSHEPTRTVRVAGPEDLPVLQNLHSKDAVRRPVVVRRDDRRWASLDSAPIAHDPSWLVAEGDNGYLRLGRLDGEWEIFELVVRDGDSATQDALIAETFRRTGAQKLGVYAADLDGTFAGSRFPSQHRLVEDLMLAVVDERGALEHTNLGSVEELRKYVSDLETNGVSFWRSDFF